MNKNTFFSVYKQLCAKLALVSQICEAAMLRNELKRGYYYTNVDLCTREEILACLLLSFFVCLFILPMNCSHLLFMLCKVCSLSLHKY